MKIKSFLINNKNNIIFVMTIILGFIFLIWRAPFGYCFNDEPFIVTLGQRLSNGDSLIFDEWHMAQTFSPVMLFFYQIYILSVGSTEGILLCFRYIYCVIWIIVCGIVFHFMLNHHYLCELFKGRKILQIFLALSVFWYLLLFSPLDYMTISYTSIGLSSTIGIVLMLLCNPDRNRVRLGFWCFFGILIAINTVCCPWMAVFYIVSAVIYFVYLIVKKQKPGLFINYFAVVVTVIILFVLYCYFFILQNNDISLLFPNIEAVLSDPEHSTNILKLLISGAYYVIRFSNVSLVFYAAALSLFFIFRNKIHTVKLFAVFLCTIGFLVSIIYYFSVYKSGFNYQMLSIAIFGFVSYLMLEEKPKRLFYAFYGVGILYAIADHLSSNTRLMAISMAFSVCGIGGIIFIFLLFEELHGTCSKKSLRSCVSCMLGVIVLSQIGTEFTTRIIRQYWDSPIYMLSETIMSGAAKGIKTTNEKMTEYEDTYDNLTVLLSMAKTSKQDEFVSLTYSPVIYLNANMAYGTFSAWTLGYSSETLYNKYSEYYKYNKDKKADVVFVNSESDLYDWFDTNDYTKYEYNGAALYVR